MSRTSARDGVARGSASSSATLRGLRITAVASVLVLVLQFVTAGQILALSPSALVLHGGGAIAIHVVFGLTVLAAVFHWRVGNAAVWPVVVLAVAFVLSFVQAFMGSAGTMSIHVPLAVVLTICVVWVAAWSFTRGARH